MTTPKKPLSKTESAIQLGNVLKYAAGRGRGGTSKGVIAKAKKLLKVGEKTPKSIDPIKEVKKLQKKLDKNLKVSTKKAAKARKRIDKITRPKKRMRYSTRKTIENTALIAGGVGVGAALTGSMEVVRQGEKQRRSYKKMLKNQKGKK